MNCGQLSGIEVGHSIWEIPRNMKVPFPNIGEVILTFCYFFQIVLISFKDFQCFVVPQTKFLGCWTVVVVFFHVTNLEPWNYSRMNFPFPNIVAVILIFDIFSQILSISFKDFQYFQVPETKFWLFDWYLGVPICVGSVLGSWNRVYRMKVSFLIISGVVLILW